MRAVSNDDAQSSIQSASRVGRNQLLETGRTTTYSLFASLWYKIRMTRRESVNGISTKLVCPWWARGVDSSSCQGEEKSWFGELGTSPGILGEDKTDVKDGTERKDALGENCPLLNVEYKGKSVVLEPRHH